VDGRGSRAGRIQSGEFFAADCFSNVFGCSSKSKMESSAAASLGLLRSIARSLTAPHNFTPS